MKKKKKGFTLIELLAIIVILAIIAVITVPIILNIIENSKRGAVIDSAYGYKDSINKYYVTELAKNSNFSLDGTYTVGDDGSITSTAEDSQPISIPFSGTKPSGGKVTIDDSVVTSACFVIDDYEVELENGKFTTDGKGDCTNGGGTGGELGDDPTVQEPVLAQQKLQSLLDEDNTEEIFKDEYNNIRYRGKTPNNYVKFNNETWRIIGYVDNHIKLIRNESIGEMPWDSTGTFGSSDWTKPADLMAYLNPSEVSNAGTDGEYWTNDLTLEAKNMIGKTTWHLGGLDTNQIKAPDAYTYERGDASRNNQPTTWEGYVGLMYPSDYGYAASEACMTSKNLGYNGYDDSTCTSTNWLYLGVHEWTQSYDQKYSGTVWYVRNTGFVSHTSPECNAHTLNVVRPVINLKSEVKIVDGTGEEDDPYILELDTD